MKSIFVSYSRADSRFVEKFLKHLKPLEHLGVIPWIDKDLVAGEDYHSEIQSRLRDCSAAVLVVSPDFLASDYVTRHELPVVLEERRNRNMIIAPLYLRESVHDMLPRGLRFSHVVSLNDPKEPIATNGDHDAAFRKGVARLVEALRSADPTPPLDPHTVPVLTVALTRAGAHLYRAYHVHDKVAEHRVPHTVPTSADELWSMLFPDEPDAARHDAERALCAAFAQPIGPVPTPSLGPLRIRLASPADDLARLRWTDATWEGQPLWQRGWTIELAARVDPRGVEEVELPGPALLLLDRDDHTGVSSQTTATDLLEAWDRTWPQAPDHPTVLTRWPDTKRDPRPDVLVYVGRARHYGGDVIVTLGDETGAAEARPLRALFASDPTVALLSLAFPVGEPTSIPLSAVPDSIPLVIAQSAGSGDSASARRARLSFWNDLLSGGVADPILSAHRHAEVPTQVFTARKRLLFHRREPAVARLVRLRLDRVAQKTRVQREVQKLFQRNASRRACCIVARGGHGNRVDLFHRQLYADLRDHVEAEWNLVLQHVSLPPAPSFDARDVETEVRRHLGLTSDRPMAAAVRERVAADEMADDVCHVVLLAFGARGGRHGPLPTSKSLENWLDFFVRSFGAELGVNVRVLALLQLEEPDDALSEYVESVRAEPRVRAKHFVYLPLEPLDRIPRNELIEFIDEPDSGCPDDLRDDFPLLLHEVTGGDFDETAEWIERAHRENWYAVADELRAKSRERARP